MRIKRWKLPLDRELLIAARNAHNRYKAAKAYDDLLAKLAEAKKKKTEVRTEKERERKRLRLELDNFDDEIKKNSGQSFCVNFALHVGHNIKLSADSLSTSMLSDSFVSFCLLYEITRIFLQFCRFRVLKG